MIYTQLGKSSELCLFMLWGFVTWDEFFITLELRAWLLAFGGVKTLVLTGSVICDQLGSDLWYTSRGLQDRAGRRWSEPGSGS